MHRTQSNPEEITVLAVDDSPPFLDLLRDVVTATPGLTCIGAVTSGEEAVAVVEQHAPRMVIIDKRMPGLGGIEAARQIVALRPETVVVIISVESPDPEVLEHTGAAAFLHKRELSPHTLSELWHTHGATRG